jgi:lysophospholipase L1-like esterase
MKQLIIALCAMGFVLAAHSQTNAPDASAPPATSAPAAEPTSPTKADNTRYVNDPNLLIGSQAQVASFSTKPCDVIFIGDTAMAGWRGAGNAIWASNYEPLKALNFSISGDKTQNALWRLNNMDIQNLKPKVAVIQIGSSNSENTAHEIADGIKAVVANTQAAFPGVKIILVSLIPSDQDNDKMMKVNSLIRGYADNSIVYYLNLVPLMPLATTTNSNGTTETNWKGLDKDHLHLDTEGYQIWANAMDPMLKKLLAGG